MEKHKFQQIHPTQTDQTILQQSKRIPMTHDLPHPDPRDPHLAQQLLPHSPWVDDFHVAHFHRLWILTWNGEAKKCKKNRGFYQRLWALRW